MFIEPIATGEIYHVFNRSISEFVIFNNDSEYSRIKDVIQFYQLEKHATKFSQASTKTSECLLVKSLNTEKLAEIICYSPMPTHLHFVLKQLKDGGISRFMNNVLNSYTRYFNIKHNRKGPLWESRFKKVLVETDEQLLHLTRYIHLNPVTAHLVDKPEEWKWSSYQEYVFKKNESIYKYNDVLDVKPDSYKIFVENRISYQRELAKIKHLMFD
jgi:putative transposase